MSFSLKELALISNLRETKRLRISRSYLESYLEDLNIINVISEVRRLAEGSWTYEERKLFVDYVLFSLPSMEKIMEFIEDTDEGP